jgi:CRISPR-associated protein Cas2
MRTTYLICYDISDEKRLRRVFKICKDYGSHLQYSVFESDLSQTEKTELEQKLSAEINAREDQVLFVE